MVGRIRSGSRWSLGSEGQAHPFKALGGESVEAFMAIAHNRENHMVDNARDMAWILADKELKARYDQFPEENHFSVLPSQIGRAIPFALSR